MPILFQRLSGWRRRRQTTVCNDEAELKILDVEGKWRELTVPEERRLGTWR